MKNSPTIAIASVQLLNIVLQLNLTSQRGLAIEIFSNKLHPTIINLAERNCIKVGNDANKIVCVCDSQNTNCDNLNFEWPSKQGDAILIESTQNGHRFRLRPDDKSNPVPSARFSPIEQTSTTPHPTISIDLDARRQQILGWGGAFTDATGVNINSLSKNMADRLLASYFGPNGLQYNFGRVPIGGSDFSSRAYSYDDSPERDLNLTNWKLAAEDLALKIPLIKQATELARSDKCELKLFASPWSPPKWMKTNNDFRRGHLIDSDEIYQCYAQYLINFFKAYRQHGIEFWGATVQNEPLSAYLPLYFFNSLQMSNSEMIKFVGKYLGPALESFGYTKANFKLMIGDDSLGFLNYHVPNVMHDKQVQRYISGLAFHWYLSGLLVPYSSLDKLLEATKGTGIEFVMMSEACQGAFLTFKHVDLGDWTRGESYASDIIEDLERETGAWIDWNMALDLQGGPNWAANFVDSPIIVDSKKDLFYKQPMYYVLAHFSRLFRPAHSSVIESHLTKGKLSGVSFVAAQVHNSNHLVLNLLNKSNSKRTFSLDVKTNNSTLCTLSGIQIEPKSVSSIILKL